MTIEDRVQKLEKWTISKECKEMRGGDFGCGAYKYTAEQIGLRFQINPDRLIELARTGYAPCAISESGEIYFHSDIRRWIEDNLFTKSGGKSLPFRVVVATTQAVAHPAPPTIFTIENLCELQTPVLPPSVYFLVKDNVVVYVGQSKVTLARIGTHYAEGYKDFDRVYYLPTPPSDLLRVEGEFIKSLDPVLNRTKNWKPPEDMGIE